MDDWAQGARDRRALEKALERDRRDTVRLLKKAGADWHALAKDSVDQREKMEFASRGDHLRTDAVAALQEAWFDAKRKA